MAPRPNELATLSGAYRNLPDAPKNYGSDLRIPGYAAAAVTVIVVVVLLLLGTPPWFVGIVGGVVGGGAYYTVLLIDRRQRRPHVDGVLGPWFLKEYGYVLDHRDLQVFVEGAAVAVGVGGVCEAERGEEALVYARLDARAGAIYVAVAADNEKLRRLFTSGSRISSPCPRVSPVGFSKAPGRGKVTLPENAHLYDVQRAEGHTVIVSDPRRGSRQGRGDGGGGFAGGGVGWGDGSGT